MLDCHREVTMSTAPVAECANSPRKPPQGRLTGYNPVAPAAASPVVSKTQKDETPTGTAPLRRPKIDQPRLGRMQLESILAQP